jgi:hypothetical protein
MVYLFDGLTPPCQVFSYIKKDWQSNSQLLVRRTLISTLMQYLGTFNKNTHKSQVLRTTEIICADGKQTES